MTTTEAQPDPQVVAWMRDYRSKHPDILNDDHAKAGLVNRYRREHPGATSLREVMLAYDEAWRPLTVADVPAGQGAASLFIARAPDGCPVLTFKDEDGDLIALEHGSPTTPSGRAFWDHLAATLPTVTEEVAP